MLCVLGVSGWLAVASGRLGRFCVRLLGWLGGAVVLAWGCFGLAWCWFWCGCGLCRDSVPTFLRVLGWLGGALVLAWCWLGLCGGNYYHRRCVAACRRRVGGLWSQNPPWLLGRARAACSLGGCVGRVRLVFVCLSWCCGLCSLVAWGNCYHRRCFAACRRRVGGLWSQNPPRGCLEGPGPRARRGVYGRKTPVWLLKVQFTSVVCG